MCEDNDLMRIEDVVDMLEGLKANLEITGAELVNHVDRAISEINGEVPRMEPLRLLKPITEELERKVQVNINRLTYPPNQKQPADDGQSSSK